MIKLKNYKNKIQLGFKLLLLIYNLSFNNCKSERVECHNDKSKNLNKCATLLILSNTLNNKEILNYGFSCSDWIGEEFKCSEKDATIPTSLKF